MKDNNWKDRLGVMYSTNPDFKYDTDQTEEEDTLPKDKQLLRILLDKKNRGWQGRYTDYRIQGNQRRSGSFGKVPEGEMRGGRICQGWRDYRAGRSASQSA